MATESKPLPPPVAKPTPPPPAARAATPPPPAGTPAAVTQADVSAIKISSGRKAGARREVIYGAGGVGKTTLAASMPGRTLVIDLERGSHNLDVDRIDSLQTWSQLRAVLQSKAVEDYANIVVDSATVAEEWALARTLEVVPHEKGGRVTNIEGYGFGKGYQHRFDTFLELLADLDRLSERGKNVVLIAHQCTADAPNPFGEDFLRYEPRLQSPASGKASIRNKVVEWAEDVIWIGYDVFAEEGKGKGSGTRTIWTSERPTHIAKSRMSLDPIPWNDPADTTIWQYLLGGA